MATLVLGSDPHDLIVKLTRGGDYFSTLQHPPDSSGTAVDWPVGITITLVIEEDEFEYTIDDDMATLVIESEVVDALIDERVKKAKLLYDEGTANVPWAVGVVESRG